MMNFDEWFTTYYNYQREYTVEEYETAQAAWNHQQSLIDDLESQLESEDEYRRQIEVLEWSVGNKNGVIKNLQLVIKDLENKLDIELKHNETLRDMQKAYQIRPRGKSMLAYLPEGYVLVPVEPTEKMLKAARNAPMPLVHLDSFTACSHLILKTQYKAMIQAAQEKE